MLRFPWVSREMHQEVVAAKDQLIASLREQIAALGKRLDAPVAVTVELPKDFAVIQPAVVDAPGRRRKQPTSPVSPIDYAEVNENDPVQLQTLVNYHLGERAGKANRWEKRQILDGILVKISAARGDKMRKAMLQATAARNGETPDPQNVPQHLVDLIETAAKGE
jgi:hypothetical protein